MNFFRSSRLDRALSLFTGMVFLNMSLVLVEIAALKTDSNKQLVEDLSRLIAGRFALEEQDAFGGSTDENTSVTELDLFLVHLEHPAEYFMLISKSMLGVINAGSPLFGNYEIYSPPPEV